MRIVFIFSLIISMLPLFVQADTWAQQQQIYNEISRRDNELFRLNEEMEDMQLDNKKRVDKLQDEVRRAKSYSNQNSFRDKIIQDTKESSNDALREWEQKKVIDEAVQQAIEKERERYVVQQEHDENSRYKRESTIQLDEEYFSGLEEKWKQSPLLAGLSDADIQNLISTHKNTTYRTIEDAFAGDTQAQVRLGEKYLSGEAVKQNDIEAAKWFQKAAERGNAQAQEYLGRLYALGRGVPENKEKSAHWYMKSAQQGWVEAQFVIASMYLLGEGLPQDDVACHEWLQKASERGHTASMYLLGISYGRGRGTPFNATEALFWLELSALRHPDYKGEADYKEVASTVLQQLTSEQIGVVKVRVADWEPMRTTEEQAEFDNGIQLQDNFIKTSLRNLSYSEQQATEILDAYKKALFPSGKNHRLVPKQINGIIELAKARVGQTNGTGATDPQADAIRIILNDFSNGFFQNDE